MYAIHNKMIAKFLEILRNISKWTKYINSVIF